MAFRTTGPDDELLTSLLGEVSRSFYLTLRVLPRPVRAQIGLAYLLARATDTIADTDCLPLESRLAGLDALRHAIMGTGAGPRLSLGEVAGVQALPAERRLLERIEDALGLLRRFEPEDRRRIQEVLATITGGQELDLRRFHAAAPGPGRVVALATAAELDDYTYRVAGCVGEFWTRMCVAHLFAEPRPPAGTDERAAGSATGTGWFEACGVRFGQGLQLVNILRDLPRDLRQGRCYLPGEDLARAGLQPADLLDPAHEARLRPVYDRWLERAEAHLVAGWSYTCAIPTSYRRLRLACAWPILIGVRTLSRLKGGEVLDPARRIKVARSEVYGLILRSLLALRSAPAWQGQMTRELGAQGRARAGE